MVAHRRRFRHGSRSALALLMLVASTCVALAPDFASSSVAHAASTIYVAPWGNNGAAGTRSAPVKTVRHAVWRARSGDAIVLRGGIYRENVQVFRKAVAISSAPGERAVFDGTQELVGWQRSDEDWFVDGWSRQYPTASGQSVLRIRPEAGHPDQVFINGRPLDQVLLRSKVVPGTFFHDTARDRIYIGDDPSGRRVEASDTAWALYFNQAHGSSLTNVTIRRYATPLRDVAAIRIHSNNVVVSGVTSELNAAAGVSIMGNGVVVRSSRFSDNGHLGVHVHRTNTVVIEDSAIIGNNKAGFDPKHSAGGIKITSSAGVTVRNNDVSRNAGPGIWTDLSTRFVTVSYNRVEENARSGIEIELSRNVNVASNVALGNGEAGIWILESQDVQVFHNATYRNIREIYVLEGPRDEVSNVTVKNNVVGNARGGRALIVVDDWTRERTAAQMGVRIDYNAIWQPSNRAVRAFSQWGSWPSGSHVNGTLETHRSTTGQDWNSVTSTDDVNPFWRDPSVGDYRAPDTVRRGSAVNGGLAAELGVQSGTSLRIGPVAITPQR